MLLRRCAIRCRGRAGPSRAMPLPRLPAYFGWRAQPVHAHAGKRLRLHQRRAEDLYAARQGRRRHTRILRGLRHPHDHAPARPAAGGAEDRNAGRSVGLRRRADGDLHRGRSNLPSCRGRRTGLRRLAAAPVVPVDPAAGVYPYTPYTRSHLSVATRGPHFQAEEDSMDSPATGSGIGQPVRRREDLRLVRGNGRYTADENLPGQVYAVMLRSPHAHARIRSIATGKAKAVPGVIAVFTGADILAGGMQPLPHIPWSPHNAEAKLRIKNGETPFEAPHHALPTDKVRFVGEAVAMIVADTVNAAKNGAEAIEIDYEILPAVVDTVPAARQDAPRVHDNNHSNVCFDSDLGDFAATEAAFARAAHVTRFETWVQRVTGVPMEP